MIEVICGYLFVFIGVAAILLPVATGIEWLGIKFLDVASEGMIKFKGYLSYFEQEREREAWILKKAKSSIHGIYIDDIDDVICRKNKPEIKKIIEFSPKVSLLKRTIFSEGYFYISGLYTAVYFILMFLARLLESVPVMEFATEYLILLMKVGSFFTPLIVPLFMLASLFFGIRYACRTTKFMEKKAIEAVREAVKDHEDNHHEEDGDKNHSTFTPTKATSLTDGVSHE